MSYDNMSYNEKMEAAREVGRSIARIYIMSGEDEKTASTMSTAYWSSASAYGFVDELLCFLRQNPNAGTGQLQAFFDSEVDKAKVREKEEKSKKLKKGLIIAAVAVVAIIILSIIF